MRKIISVLLALAMLFSCGMVTMAEEVATTAVGAEEIDFLARLGIMEADADPEATITRAEMAKIVMMCLGQGANVPPADTPFTDVDSSNEYSGYIQLANGANIMVGNGDGKFNPNGNVTYNQMVKLLTHAIGHEAFAQAAGGYPGGYLITASSNEMLVGTTPSGEQAVPHGVAAILIKNALDIDVYERSAYGDSYEYISKAGVTTLTKFFDVYKFQGIITSNYTSSLSGTANIKKDEIILDGATVLKTGNSGAENYLGYLMTIYAEVDKDGRQSTIVAAYPEYNTITVVNGDDVMNRTSNTLLVYLDEAGEEEELKIDINAKMIYNGSSKIWTDADLKGNFGDITAIDNDNDDDADVLIVYNYRNVIVNSVKADDNIVYGKDEVTPIEIDPENRTVKTTFVKADGKEAAVKNLKEWNVISIALSENGDVMNAILCDKAIEGTIEAFDDDTITVSGTEYKYDATKVAAPSSTDFGRKAVFYLDFTGRIATIDFNGAISGMEYGYVRAAGVSGTGFNRKVEIEMLAGEGITVFELAKEVKLNGAPLSNEAVVTDPAIQSAGAAIKQLIMYSLDAEGKINKINTADDDTDNHLSAQEKADTFTIDKVVTGRGETKYQRAIRGFAGKYLVSADTKIFMVQDPDDMVDREDLYAVWSQTALDSYYVWGKVSIYDVDDDRIAGAVVIQYQYDSFSYSTGLHTGGIITGITQALNEEDELVTRYEVLNHLGVAVTVDVEDETKILAKRIATNVEYDPDGPNAYLFDGNGELKTDLTVADIKVGDFIQYTTNKINEKTEQITLVARLDALEVRQNDLGQRDEYANDGDPKYPIAYSTVTDIFRDGIELTTIEDRTGAEVSKLKLVATTAVIYHYDTTTKKVSKITRDYLVEGESKLFNYGDMFICIE